MAYSLLLTCGNSGYLMVEEGKWTCVACMDRKVRNWKDVLRHEKSGEHTRAMATRLQTIGNSFSGVPGSADAETTVSTLQDLLLNLAGEHGETSEQDTPGMVGSVDGEGSNKVLDVSVLSASLLAQFDNDDGLDTHQVSSLELEGRGQSLSYSDLSLFYSHRFSWQEGRMIVVSYH